MKRTKVWFDTEFTGLHKNTTLISIGLVSEEGHTFYAEFTDYDKKQITPWLETNVLFHLRLQHMRGFTHTNITPLIKREVVGDTATITKELREWLNQYKQIEIWSDCLAYDWVLFCQLFGGAMSIPKNIYYIPFDLCTLFLAKGVDPDISRKEFAGKNLTLHNALDDALLQKACTEKLLKGAD